MFCFMDKVQVCMTDAIVITSVQLSSALFVENLMESEYLYSC